MLSSFLFLPALLFSIRFLPPAAAQDPLLAAEEVLEDFHDAAARADGERYFGHFTEDAIFLGTDAGERWDVTAFRSFAEPYFGEGRGWTYVASERHLTLGASRKVAWFDERLQNEHYGEVRGSGVLVRDGREWRIAQYNLAIPVPNELSKELVGRIAAQLPAGVPRGELHALEREGRALELWEKVGVERLERPAAERPAVLLLPDLHFRARAIWDAPQSDYSVMDALARRGFDVFVLDPPGCGFAAPPEVRGSAVGLAYQDDVWLAIDWIRERRGVEGVALVGVGWGASLAAALATSDRAGDLRAVVLYDYDPTGALLGARLLGAFGGSAAQAGPHSITRATVLSRFAAGTYEQGIPESFLADSIKAGKRLPPVDWQDPAAWPPPAEPGRLKMPCLLLHGDRLLDEALPDAAKLEEAERAALRTFYAELGGPKLRMVIPETGPWPHLATPHRLFQRCLAGWLERLSE